MLTKYKLDGKHMVGIGIAIVAIITLVFCITTKVKAANMNNIGKQIRVKSIMIQEGDTLWEIAKENYSEEFKDLNSYIQSIKECNNISSDTIHTGMYLIVPYY